jgi:hypothetical protein
VCNLGFVGGVSIVLESGNMRMRGKNMLKVNDKCKFDFALLLRQLECWCGATSKSFSFFFGNCVYKDL